MSTKKEKQTLKKLFPGVEFSRDGNSVTIPLPGTPMPKGVKKTMKLGDEIDNPWHKNSVFFWCLHCERAYRRGECREIEGLQMCPYEECDGDTFCDGWPWEKIREANPHYPVIPEEGTHYPLYPETSKKPKAKK